MTTLELEDNDSGKKWELPQVQLSEAPYVGNTDIFPSPGIPSEDTFISVLGEQETFELTGLVTAPSLSGKSSPNSYSSDWRTALAEFAVRGESFCHAAQHTGYTLKERDRDRTSINVVIDTFQWTYESGAPFQLSYQLVLRHGDGLLPDDSISIPSVTPGSKDSVPTLGSQDLSGFDSLKMEKSLELSVSVRAFGDGAAENDIISTEGPTRTFEYTGEYPGDASTRNTFDDNLRSKFDDTTYTFDTVFPGYSPDVKAIEMESNRKAEFGANKHEYTVKLLEGV